MPRKARLDAFNTLHHVMARGIERSLIFRDDHDRMDFLEHLGILSEETKTTVYAWALMPNHFHILLRSGPGGLPHFMRRLLTGYAVRFNKRHARAGHLFQNRYASIVCEEDLYFMELIRYIHLNPVAAHIVETMRQLDSYRFTGHSVIMGTHYLPWQDIGYVLSWFNLSRVSYRSFMQKGIDHGATDLDGGGLLRLLGERLEVSHVHDRDHVLTDQRVLGTGDFVEQLLKQKIQKRNSSPTEQARRIENVLKRYCRKAGITIRALKSGSRAVPIPRIRSEIARVLIRELGLSYTETARLLGVSHVAVSKMIKRETDHE